MPPGAECRATGSGMPCHWERNAVPPGSECRATGSGMPCRCPQGAECRVPHYWREGVFAIEIAFLRLKLPLDREQNAVPK